MKRIVLYCLTCVLLSACIREDTGDCAEARFFVTHEHNVAEFDTEIGNDVHYQVFQDDILLYSDIAPYETIKGGQEYVIRNYDSGTYRIVAWAVPADDPDVPVIPTVTAGGNYRDLSLALSRMADNDAYYQPIGQIYLGETVVTLEQDVSSRHEISLSSCIAKVYFTLNRANLLVEPNTYADDIPNWIELEGTSASMSADRIAGTDPSIIYKDLTYFPGEAILFSDAMGVLPSATDQYLKVTMYRGGEKFCLVETREQAIAGSEVWIEATIGQDVVVYVNGWRVKNATITYF
ncbi:MAG: FimB/Mfa2 family fimbrial subunit [Tannerellaceae bacterium]|nr:FimB/Mfa2 family fimbrial subunit [Tannerellaceae bacterium]